MNKQILRSTILTGLFLIPFIPFLVSSELFFPFITTKVFVWRIIVEVIFAAWLLLALLDENYSLKKSGILYAVIAFLVAIGISDLFGVAPLKSFWSNFERMEGYLSLLHLSMFFIVISSVFTEVEWKRWWNTSLVASFIMVMYGILQILGLKTINQGGVRVDGTFGNAIYLAVYMFFHMFVATLFLWREWKNVALRWVYGLLILSQAFILYYTATRGAILGLIGGLLVVALLNIRNRESAVARKAGIYVICLLAVLVGGFWLIRNTDFVMKSPVLSRFTSLQTEVVNRQQGRYFVWPMAIKGWKERPILGWGQENFNYVFQEHYQPEMYYLEPWFDRAHNIFLDWLVTGGLVGLLSYLTLYLISLYLLWRRTPALSHAEKSIITGLVAAYFFHNLFVFDHLVSYILFFSLLAYIHQLNSGAVIWQKIFSPIQIRNVVLPIVIIILLPSIYFVNIKPALANFSLIEGLKAIQVSGDIGRAVQSFKKAHGTSRLGRVEVIEQITYNSTAIFNSSLSIEDKQSFFDFAKKVMLEEIEDQSMANDARYRLMAGTFLSSAGLYEGALEHLNKAHELMPKKQQIYFEIGAAYVNLRNLSKALEIFKEVYLLAPDYVEAKAIYLIGAIYAGDRATENEMLGRLIEREIVFDNRIIEAYYAVGRTAVVRSLLEARVRLDPANAETYREYLNSLAN